MPRPQRQTYTTDHLDRFVRELEQLAQDLKTQADRVRDAGINELEIANCRGMNDAPDKIRLFIASAGKALIAEIKSRIDVRDADSAKKSVLKVAEATDQFQKKSTKKK